jgi:hypothetical protein
MFGPFLLLIIVHASLALMRDRPLIFADEAGYIGNARYLAGGLPIKLVKSMAYSPGYSLLLTPLFWLGLSPPHTYQGILIVNGLLISTCYFSLVYWVRWVLGDERRYAYPIAFATSLYPAFLVQPLFAMSESAIIALFSVLPIVAFWLVKSKKALAGVVFALLVAFLYTVHARFLGVILVSVVGLAGLAVTRVLRWRVLAASLFTLGIGIVLGRQLTAYTTAASRGHSINAGAKLSSLTTADGIWNFLVEAMGQFWYLIVASAGFAVLGLIATVTVAAKPPGAGPRRASPAWNALVFTIASSALGFGVASLFLSGASRVDHFIYGRYNEGAVAPFIATGLWSLTRLPRVWWLFACRALFVAASGTLLGALLLWSRGTAWDGSPNLANVLAIVPQLTLLSKNDLLGISLIAAGGYLVVALASLWRPLLGIGLLGAGFAFAGYLSHLYFLRMQEGRASAQLIFDRIARIPGVSKVSYDSTFFEPVTAFFGQYFLPDIEFDFFLSGRDQAPAAPYVIGHQSWSKAGALADRLITKDSNGYCLWDMNACCPAADLSFQSLGATRVPTVAEDGFYNTESWAIGAVRWTNGNAALFVPVGDKDVSTSNLFIDIASVGPSRSRVMISANGKDLFSGRLARGRSRLMFPLEGVPVTETLELRIQSKSFVPEEGAASPDPRQLGIAIHEIRVISECCLAEHNPFSAKDRRLAPDLR